MPTISPMFQTTQDALLEVSKRAARTAFVLAYLALAGATS